MKRLEKQSPRQIPAEFDKRLARQVAAYMRRTGADWWRFFNNFFCRLPGGMQRSMPLWLQNSPYSDERASKKRRALTSAQFYVLIDRLIMELGLDEDRIKRLVQSDTIESIEELYVYVLPLYLRLRAEGFKHYPDLTV